MHVTCSAVHCGHARIIGTTVAPLYSYYSTGVEGLDDAFMACAGSIIELLERGGHGTSMPIEGTLH